MPEFQRDSFQDTAPNRFPDATVAMFSHYIKSLKTCATMKWLELYSGVAKWPLLLARGNDVPTDHNELHHIIDWIQYGPRLPTNARRGSLGLLEPYLVSLGQALSAFDAVQGALARLELALRLWDLVQPVIQTRVVSQDFLIAALHVVNAANKTASNALHGVWKAFKELLIPVSAHPVEPETVFFADHGRNAHRQCPGDYPESDGSNIVACGTYEEADGGVKLEQLNE
jgi:hypothetical protein